MQDFTQYASRQQLSRQVIDAIVADQPPDLATRMLDKSKVCDACVVRPHLAATPGADVENMIKSKLDHTAMADNQHLFALVLLGGLVYAWKKGALKWT